MFAIHFYENNTPVLSQLLNSIPSVDEKIKIKGRKGTIVSVKQIDEYRIHVHVIFEKVDKNQRLATDVRKKRR